MTVCFMMNFKVHIVVFILSLQYKTVYKKIVHTRNVTVTLNLTDSVNVTESNLTMKLSRVLHTIQVNTHYLLFSACSNPTAFAE